MRFGAVLVVVLDAAKAMRFMEHVARAASLAIGRKPQVALRVSQAVTVPQASAIPALAVEVVGPMPQQQGQVVRAAFPAVVVEVAAQQPMAA